MPAYFDTGFSVRQPMWHGEGEVLADYPTDWEDARKKAGLMWEPELRPVFHLINGEYVEIPNKQVVVRDDTQAPLGVTSDEFALIYHKTMGEILDALLGQGLKFETSGSCRGGAEVWALVYLDEPERIAGDDSESYPFVALLNNHDGSGACKALPTSVRVVCWNTYNAASMQGERTGKQFVFRHSGAVLDRIEEAKAAMAGVRDEYAAWKELAEQLVKIRVDDDTFDQYLVEFIPAPEAEIVSPRVRENIAKSRARFKSLYFDSITLEAHRGTALGLVDASVEYLDHVRGFRNRDTYMGRTLLRPEPMKARALNLVRSVVK